MDRREKVKGKVETRKLYKKLFYLLRTTQIPVVGPRPLPSRSCTPQGRGFGSRLSSVGRRQSSTRQDRGPKGPFRTHLRRPRPFPGSLTDDLDYGEGRGDSGVPSSTEYLSPCPSVPYLPTLGLFSHLPY